MHIRRNLDVCGLIGRQREITFEEGSFAERSRADHSKKFAYSVVSRRDDLGYAVRNQHWRYGKWPNGEELYDLDRDPHERHNVAGAPEMRRRLELMRSVLRQTQTMARSHRHTGSADTK